MSKADLAIRPTAFSQQCQVLADGEAIETLVV